MKGAVVYLGAPVRRGFGWKNQRHIKIELADWREDGGSYTPGETILEMWIDVPNDTPDKCYVIESTKVTVV